MSPGEMKAIVQRIIDELYNRGNLDLVDELFAPEFVYHDPRTPEEGVDLDAYKEYVAFMRATFPDLQVVTDEMIVEGDAVAQRWHATATHQGEFFGVAPTGKQITNKGVNWVRIRHGQVVELRIASDTLGILQQLGVVPETASEMA